MAVELPRSWLTYQGLWHIVQYYLLQPAVPRWASSFCLKFDVPTEMGFLFPGRGTKQPYLILGGDLKLRVKG